MVDRERPDHVEDSSSASRLSRACFVSWSPDDRGDRDGGRGPPTATAPRRASVRRPKPARARSWTSRPGCPAACGARGRNRSLGTIGQPLVVDAERRGGTRAEPLSADRLSAALADPVGAVVQARDRPVDAGEGLLRPLLQTRPELALERDGSGIGADAARHAHLLVHRALAILMHRRERADDTRSFTLEQPSELRRLDGVHASPPAAVASRASISPAESPGRRRPCRGNRDRPRSRTHAEAGGACRPAGRAPPGWRGRPRAAPSP